jgi:uncharacterized membrane protein (DUF373 family)
MLDYLKRFEHVIVLALMVMMALVLLLATVELGWIILRDVLTPPVLILEIDELLEIFGLFLLVLIGLELLESIRVYLIEHVVHLEVVLEVGMIALARKAIILNTEKLSGLTLLGIAALFVALAVGYYVVKRLSRR